MKGFLRDMHWSECLLVLLVFIICLTGACLLPMDQCPDELGRQLLSNWMHRTGKLPTGDEAETLLMPSSAEYAISPLTHPPVRSIGAWGFSYALRPYLSSMAGACFMKVVSFLTASGDALLTASRMGSVLAVSLTCFFCLRLGHLLFRKRISAILMAVIVCFLPQVLFLGMYQNNDALTLCAVSMLLYFFIRGNRDRWSVRSCAGMGGGFSLGLLSYYSVYGWLLIFGFLCVLSVLLNREDPRRMRTFLRMTVWIAGICLLLAGWFFIRNAVLHGGDFLGIASEAASRARLTEQGVQVGPYNCPREQGISLTEFFTRRDREFTRMTFRSFICVFGYMDIYLPDVRYGIYYAFFLLAIVLYAAVFVRKKKSREDWMLCLLMAASGVITLFLTCWGSYMRDYQPQGRYIITLIIPIAFMLAWGLDPISPELDPPAKEKCRTLHPGIILTIAYLLMSLWAFTEMVPRLLS